jgi:hypothetical protein
MSEITEQLKHKITTILNRTASDEEVENKCEETVEASVKALNISEHTMEAQKLLEKEFANIITQKTSEKGVNPQKTKKILSEIGGFIERELKKSEERSELVAVLDTIDRLESELLCLPHPKHVVDDIKRFETYISDVQALFKGGNIPPKEGAWLNICRKILMVRKGELELLKLAEKRFHLVESRYRASDALGEAYTRYHERWEAQSGGDAPRRHRVLSDDISLRYIIERSDPPPIDTTEMFDHACDILGEIRGQCMALQAFSRDMKDSDEKASVRKAMYQFYLQVNKALMAEPKDFDVSDIGVDWKFEEPVGFHRTSTMRDKYVAQSGGCDALIRRMKIDDRIRDATPAHGLGKSRKSGLAVPKCSFRPSVSRVGIPTSSHRRSARDKYSRSREEKLNRNSDFVAQSWIAGMVPDIKLDPGSAKKVDDVIAQMQLLNQNGIRVELDLLSNVRQHFATLFSNLGTALTPLLVGLGVAFCAFKAYVTRSAIWSSLTTVSAMCATLWGLPPSLMALIERFRGIAAAPDGAVDIDGEIFDVEQFEAQSGKESLSNCILTYVYTSMFSDLKSGNMVCEYLKKTADVPKWKQGLSCQIDFFISLIQSFLDYMHVHFGTPEYQLSQHPYPEASSFAMDAEKLSHEFNGGLDYNYENGQRYYALVAKGKTVMAKIPSSVPEGREARQMIMLALASMRTIGDKLARANIVNNGPRIPPVGVMIGGPSGVGKSALAQFLMNRVTAHIIPDEMRDAFERNHNDTTFTRNAENGFWDGYHGQFNVYDDDIGQMKDVPGQTDNGYMEHIRMISPGNYPLTMAHLEDKGNVNFRSSMVYATTNRRKFELQSMYSNEPFCRRFSIAYVMVPKKEYSIPSGASELSIWGRRISHFPESRSDTSHLEFFKWNPEDGTVAPNSISYDQLVSIIVDAYRKAHLDGTIMMELHQKDKEAALRERDKERGVIRAQAGDDDTAKSEYHDAVAEILPEHVLKAAPEHLLESGAGGVLNAMAREAKVSIDFATQHAKDLPKDESWHMLVARLAIKAEQVQNTVATSHDSLTTRVCRQYLAACAPYVKQAVKMAGDHKTLITTALAAIGLLKVALTMLNGSVPETAQSVGGMRHPKHREFSSPKVFSKRGERFKAYDLKPRKSGTGHMQLRGKGLVTQAGGDGNSVDIIRKVVRKCQYTIRLPGSTKPMGKMTFVTPWIALAPLHFGERLQYGIDEGEFDEDSHVDIWSVVTPEQKISISVADLEIKTSEVGADNDWCLIRIPEVIERTPNILKYWAAETQLIDRGQFSIILNMVRDHDCYLHQATALVRKGVSYEQYNIAQGYTYDIETISGDCGGLLAQCNKAASGGKLIGIHTAGHGSKGFGPRILRHEIEFALQAFDDVKEKDIIVEDEMDEIFDMEIDASVIPGFKAQCYGRPVPSVGSTSIRRSPLHNTYLKSNMAPAILRPKVIDGVECDPMAITRAKYAKPVVAMNPLLLKLIADYVLSRMCRGGVNNAPWLSPRIFSFEEACAGIPGIPYLEGIPRDTSPGYPFKLDTPSGFKGKTHFFGVEAEYEFTSEYCVELKKKVLDIEDKARRGIRCVHVFMDFLKDERRPMRKVKTCSTRMVSACPLDLLIIHRMYFLDFVRWMMDNRITNGSAVGVNCYSAEWDLLAKELETVITPKHFAAVIAGDYSGYDGSITTQIQFEILRIINVWYGDEHSLIRQVLWEDICASRHISGDVIYEWTGCNPSGCFPTTALNTLTGAILIIYSYVIAHLEHEGLGLNVGEDGFEAAVKRALDSATQYVRYMCFGDDNLVAVASVVEEFFNQEAMTRILATVGYKYTSEAKDGVAVEKLRPLSEVSFLKRSFARSDRTGKRLCPLELSVILEMPQWTNKRDHNFDDVKVNVDTALKELSLHTREVYDCWSKCIVKESLNRLGYIPEVTDYDTLQALTLASSELL